MTLFDKVNTQTLNYCKESGGQKSKGVKNKLAEVCFFSRYAYCLCLILDNGFILYRECRKIGRNELWFIKFMLKET